MWSRFLLFRPGRVVEALRERGGPVEEAERARGSLPAPFYIGRWTQRGRGVRGGRLCPEETKVGANQGAREARSMAFSLRAPPMRPAVASANAAGTGPSWYHAGHPGSSAL